LDEADNDAVRFWAHLIGALRTLHPDLGQTTWQLLHAPQRPAVSAILTPLLNDIAALPGTEGRTLLVLDDYHVISAPAVHEGVSFLLEHQPLQLHLVLLTRADPPLPVARLRARGQLTELRGAQLRFTTEEAAAFLNERMGLDLPAEEIQALASRTEGWIVGLQLAALSLQEYSSVGEHSRTGDFIQTFTGSHHYILEYLTEEVLCRQPQTVQQFLAQTSILDLLCAALGNAVTGRQDSAAMLDYLQQRNLFVIPLDVDRQWYRYHHLFADLLRGRLQRDVGGGDVAQLHRRASIWYEQEGLFEEAVAHAQKSGDLGRTARLIEGMAKPTMVQGRLSTLMQWVEALPKEYLSDRLRIDYGWACFLAGRTEVAEQIFLRARASLEGLPLTSRDDALWGELSSYLATISSMQSDTSRTVELAQEALEHLPENDRASRARALRALGTAHGLEGNTDELVQVYTKARSLARESGNVFLEADTVFTLAGAQVHLGRLQEAERIFQEGVALAEQRGGSPESPLPFAAVGLAGLAEIYLEWNDPGTASQYLEQCFELNLRGGVGYHLVSFHCAEAGLKVALGDLPGALEALERAEQIVYQYPALSAATHLAMYQVRLRLQQGDVATASRWASAVPVSEEVTVQLEDLPVVLREVQQVSLARIHLAQGETEQVLVVYDTLCPIAEAAGRMARVIEMGLLKALALQALDQIEEALSVLERTLDLAEPGGYVRSFLELGEPMEELLRIARTRDTTSAYVGELLEAFDPGSEEPMPRRPAPSQPLVEPLSERELEILRLIEAGYSNQQIADQLVVTLHTAKKHASNIYGKLGVRSRTQAVARARELGLL
jgi:LuxR family maltose regulon positive regulatory protein